MYQAPSWVSSSVVIGCIEVYIKNYPAIPIESALTHS